jgi:hypothetical protein
VLQNGFTLTSASGTESKQKTWAYIKRQWCFGLGGHAIQRLRFWGLPDIIGHQKRDPPIHELPGHVMAPEC